MGRAPGKLKSPEELSPGEQGFTKEGRVHDGSGSTFRGPLTSPIRREHLAERAQRPRPVSEVGFLFSNLSI